jgi:hypothetical protein
MSVHFDTGTDDVAAEGVRPLRLCASVFHLWVSATTDARLPLAPANPESKIWVMMSRGSGERVRVRGGRQRDSGGPSPLPLPAARGEGEQSRWHPARAFLDTLLGFWPPGWQVWPAGAEGAT